MSGLLVSQNGCAGEGGNSQWNVGRTNAYTCHGPDRRARQRVSRSEGMVASSTVGPGSRALLVSGRVACALPYHLSGLALVWSLYYRDIGACWVVL